MFRCAFVKILESVHAEGIKECPTNKRTPPNKRALIFHIPCIPRKSAGLKKSTRHQPSECSRVNIVEPRSVCCERGCKRGMLLLHVA